MEVSPELSLQWRKEISARSGISTERIFMHCTHTHSAPRTGAWISEGQSNHTYLQRIQRTLIDNAVRTIISGEDFKPFRLETGEVMTSINGNRCEKEGDPVDRVVKAIRFIDRQGLPIVSVINVSCHPVCMGPGSLLVSPDYPGITERILSEAWGGDIFQLTGAAGNMDPVCGPAYVDYAEDTGKSLADSLLKIKFRKNKGDGALRFFTDTVALPYRIDTITRESIIAHADEISKWGVKVSPTWESDVEGWKKQILQQFDNGKIKNHLDFTLGAVSVDGVVFFFTQGEPFCEYRMILREKFPNTDIVFAGYTNGQNSYLPSSHAFRQHSGYEYEIDQMHIYIKAPYPLSDKMPDIYTASIDNTIKKVLPDMNAATPNEYGIIPTPQSLIPLPGRFVMDRNTRLEVRDKEFEDAARYFRSAASAAAGFSLDGNGSVILLKKTETLGPEEYRLDIGKERVVIEASGASGAFYGIQSLMQLMPEGIYGSSHLDNIIWSAPCCKIEDKPLLPYRGLLFDSGRYFFRKEDIMRFIDVMAMHKQNMLHWHLTEDQGWRIQIDKYPLLTSIGAWRKETAGHKGPGNGIPHGGFYSKEDIREIVEYARRRCVTVIPEIEIPGHCTAALAAYPQFGCKPDKHYEVETRWGIHKNLYCPKAETFRFLEDIFNELFDLFPSPYYHIGGDEAPKDAWDECTHCRDLMEILGIEDTEMLQTFFVKRIGDFLKKHGKTVIGWDEILDGGALDEPIAMSYRGHAPAVKGIKRGIRVILTPNRWCYLDNMQDDQPDDVAQEVFMPLKKVYEYYPSIDTLETLSKEYIIGHQVCLWTEYIDNAPKAEFMAFPRSLAAAEVGWTSRDKKDWESFRHRMEKGLARLDMKGIRYCRTYYDVIFNYDRRLPFPKEMSLELDYPHGVIHYTTDGTPPTEQSPLYDGSPLIVDRGDIIRARGFSISGIPLGKEVIKKFTK